jgi:hypothetical protein
MENGEGGMSDGCGGGRGGLGGQQKGGRKRLTMRQRGQLNEQKRVVNEMRVDGIVEEEEW